MGNWVVCMSAILVFWVTMTSAQMNICKLRLRFLFIFYEIFNFASGRHGPREQPG